MTPPPTISRRSSPTGSAEQQPLCVGGEDRRTGLLADARRPLHAQELEPRVEARKAADTIKRVMPNDPANGGLNVVSDDRTNSLVVSGPAEAVKAVDDLVQKLDTPAAQNDKPKKE